MNDALGVDHDFDVVIVQPKEVMRFDHLKPLVHQGCGIHGDFAAHAPVGMARGIADGRFFQIRSCPVAEGSSGGSELNSTQARRGDACGQSGVFCPGGALQALEDGGVFGISRQQSAATLFQFRQHHRPCGDQSFFVGQGQILSRSDRSQRWK